MLNSLKRQKKELITEKARSAFGYIAECDSARHGTKQNI